MYFHPDNPPPKTGMFFAPTWWRRLRCLAKFYRDAFPGCSRAQRRQAIKDWRA